MLALILIFAIVLGQVVKIPSSTQGGLTILDITVILLSIWALLRNKFKLHPPPIFIKLALVFSLISLVSLILTPLHLTFSEYLISGLYVVRFLSFLLFGWVIYSKVLPGLDTNITQILTFSGIIMAVLGLLQFIFLPNMAFLLPNGWDPHYFRAVSTLFDPNFFGGFCVLTLVLLTIKGPQIFKPKLFIVLYLLTYLAFITTYSRSSAVMLFVSFSILSFLQKSIKLFFLTLILTLGFTLNFLTYQNKVAEPMMIDRTASAEARLDTWQQGWQLFSSHPILGVGFNAYKFAIREYNLGSQQFLQARGATTNDSSLLYVASTTGIIGLIAYLTIFIFLSIAAYKAYIVKNPWGIIFLAGTGGLFVHSTFANSLFYPWILLWIILVAIKLSPKP